MPISPPDALTILVSEVLELLDGSFSEFAEGIANDSYAFWLGAGISRGRMPTLLALLMKVLSHLYARVDPASPACRFRKTMARVLGVALTPQELARIDLNIPPDQWPEINAIVDRLAREYAAAFAQVVDDEELDYLLWDAIQVADTYGDPAATPDTEHLCVAALVLEGAVSSIASANWDGLVEKAVLEMSGSADALKVCIKPDDVREHHGVATLYKFHGCAVCARNNPAAYRDFIVGRQPQLNSFITDRGMLAARLLDIAVTKPTLALGLSFQDKNLQTLFANAESQMKWNWPTKPPAYVFAEDQIGMSQDFLLQNVYRSDYKNPRTRRRILDSALIRAYAKTLLIALWLHVLSTKLKALLRRVVTWLSDAEFDGLSEGLVALRSRVASVCEKGKEEQFVKASFAAMRRCLALFDRGEVPDADDPEYIPLSQLPVKRLDADVHLQSSGFPELAVALALVGLLAKRGKWILDIAKSMPRPGAVQVTAGVGSETQLFFVANAQSALTLVKNGNVQYGDKSVMIHSHEAPSELTRAPRKTRRGSPIAFRSVSVRKVLNGKPNVDDMLREFHGEIAI